MQRGNLPDIADGQVVPLISHAVGPLMGVAWVLAAAAAIVGVVRLVIQLMRIGVGGGKAQSVGQPMLQVDLQRIVARGAFEIGIPNTGIGVERTPRLKVARTRGGEFQFLMLESIFVPLTPT